jgi:hypothetical protein
VIDPSDDSDGKTWMILRRRKLNINTMSLQYFASKCDRYGVSDRAGAKIGRLLKDMGVVNKHNKDKLNCPTKLWRERKKWGAKLEMEQNQISLPQGLYTDGKRVSTLVRQTTETRVQLPERRGRGAYKKVVKTSNTMVIEYHNPIVV